MNEDEDRLALLRALRAFKRVWQGGDEPPRRTSEELRTLAREVVTGQVYLTNDPEAIRLSFGLILMLVMAEAPRSWIDKIAAVYAPMSSAGDRGINGYPMFFSMNVLHVDDVEEFNRHLTQMQTALK